MFQFRQVADEPASHPEKLIAFVSAFGKPVNASVHSLKILLQHKGTGRYLTEAGAWVDHEEEAKDFPDSACATKFCREHALRDVQITLRFETGLPDIALPVE